LSNDARNVRVFGRLADLASDVRFPAGTLVRVEETHELFHSVGTTLPIIADRLGWTQGSVWLPESAMRRMEINHPEFADPVQAIGIVLTHPIAVCDVPDVPNQVQFFADAQRLRQERLVRSRSIRTVDVLIELRRAADDIYLRAFHLSPMRKPKEGRLRWP
jgi:hypothetical protein